MDKIFANGIIFKEPSHKAPDFVVGGISVKKSEFIPFLESREGDWVNLSIKLNKAGKPYIELDTWKPDKAREIKETVDELIPPIEDNPDSLF